MYISDNLLCSMSTYFCILAWRVPLYNKTQTNKNNSLSDNRKSWNNDKFRKQVPVHKSMDSIKGFIYAEERRKIAQNQDFGAFCMHNDGNSILVVAPLLTMPTVIDRLCLFTCKLERVKAVNNDTIEVGFHILRAAFVFRIWQHDFLICYKFAIYSVKMFYFTYL